MVNHHLDGFTAHLTVSTMERVYSVRSPMGDRIFHFGQRTEGAIQAGISVVEGQMLVKDVHEDRLYITT